ncbi:MAG: hypothetical protein OEV94_10670 [Deltaproteobacteria bacterium]|nr:hypothetical protein [Deltaproteobacteria bacterium]
MKQDAYLFWLNRLENHAQYRQVPHGADQGRLAPLAALLQALENPHQALRVVHLAGTNGKTTTAHLIARLLARETGGERVGLYTSPHLVDIRERIQIQGRMISRRDFVAASRAVWGAAEELGLLGGESSSPRLSWFDLVTAMGLWHFRRRGAAWAVLETGLGGLADATNLAPKTLCVLTPMGLDHAAVLGNTLGAIAWQKAGILAPGVPVVLGPQPPEAQQVVQDRAAALGCPIIPWDRVSLEKTVPQPANPQPVHRQSQRLNITARWPGGATASRWIESEGWNEPFRLAAATALSAAEELLAPPRKPQSRLAAVLGGALPGRQTFLPHLRLANGHTLPWLMVDGGHNPPALEALARRLEHRRGYTLVWGMLTDKLIPETEPPLARLMAGARRVLAVPPPGPRSPAPGVLGEITRRLAPANQPDPLPQEFPRLEEALAQALAAGDPVVVAGSLWLAGEAWAWLQSNQRQKPG